MTTKSESESRFQITEAPSTATAPQHERGVLQEVGHGVWLAAATPQDASGFRWIVRCVPAGTQAGWRFGELDAIVARVLPALQDGGVLFLGEPREGLAPCAAAACLLAAGQRDHVQAALGMARWPGTKLPKPVRRSLRDWWEARSGLLPPTVDSWDALRRVPAFEDAWELLAMAPFNARDLLRYADALREGLGEATPFLTDETSEEENVMATLVADFAERAHRILRELSAQDAERGAALTRRWWAWYADLLRAIEGSPRRTQSVTPAEPSHEARLAEARLAEDRLAEDIAGFLADDASYVAHQRDVAEAKLELRELAGDPAWRAFLHIEALLHRRREADLVAVARWVGDGMPIPF